MRPFKVVAFGYADGLRIVGTGGVRETWSTLGVPPLGTGSLYRRLFGHEDDTYRRLDRQTRAVVLAVAATGVEALLDATAREGVGIIAETARGSLEVDQRYASILATGVAHGPIFPYTLQSTCLGDVALRHGLRGPTLSFSVDESARGEALREAARQFELSETEYVMVGAVEAQSEPLATSAPELFAVFALLASPREPAPSVFELPNRAEDAFSALASHARGLSVRGEDPS